MSHPKPTYSPSHDKITQQIRSTINAGVRQMFGLQVNSATSFFKAIDRDDSGELDAKEISNGLKRLGASISIYQIKDWVNHLDVDQSGHIDAIEFITHIDECSVEAANTALTMYKPVKANAKTRTRSQDKPMASTSKSAGDRLTKKLQKLLKTGKVMVRGVRLRDAVSLFNAIDNDYSGTLSKHEIREVFKGLHLGVDEQAILHWMRDLDEDGSGAVDAEEFLEKILQRKPTELELKNVKGGAHMNSNGTVRTDNLKKGKGTGIKAQNESITKQILLSLESSCKRSIFGHFVTDTKSLFHALDRDSSGSVDKLELGKGLRRLGIHCSAKQMNQWVNSLKLNDEGKMFVDNGYICCNYLFEKFRNFVVFFYKIYFLRTEKHKH